MISTGKFLLSGGLILASGSYAWWHHLNQHPVTLAGKIIAPAAAPKTAASKPQPAAPVVAMNAPPPAAAAPAAPAASDETPPPAKISPKAEVAAKPRTPRTQSAAAPEPAPPPAPPADPLNAVTLATPPPISTGHYQDGEFIGNAFDGEWGPVQVKVVVRNGDIADVICLEYPIHRARSAEISEWALPQLHEEAIRAQSEKIDWVTQASFTSENYQQSLASALSRARKQP